MRTFEYKFATVNSGCLKGYLHENDENMKRPAIIICPGGGYRYLTPHEGDPVAMAYFAKGYNTFICYYPICDEAVYPAPQLAAFEAIKYVRDNAEELNVIVNNLAIAGFSAGGHVASCTGVLYDNDVILEKLQTTPDRIKPDAMVLIYPCIGVDIEGYKDGISKKNVLRCDELVNKETTSAFIVTSFGDKLVSCNQSLNMARALSDNDVPFELHVFEPGDHGFLNNNDALLHECTTRYIGFDSWFGLSTEWLRDRWNCEVGFGKNISTEGRIKENYFEMRLMGS